MTQGGSRALPLLTAPLPLGRKNQLPKVRGDGDCSRKKQNKNHCENKKPTSDSTHPEINPFPQGKVDF